MSVSEEEMKLRFEFERQRAQGGAQAPAQQGEFGQSQEQYLRDNANEYSFGEAALIGMGREGDKLGSGIADIYDSMLEKFGSSKVSKDATASRKARAKDQANKDKYYDILSDERTGATMTGQIAPYLLSGGAGLVRAGGQALLRSGLTAAGKEIPKALAKKAAKDVTHMSQKSLAAEKAAQAARVVGEETALGALEGAAHYDDSALEGGAWGLGGGLAGRYAGRILGGNPVKLGGEDQRIVDFAKKHDQFVPPGMSSGDAAIQQLDGALASHNKTAQIWDDQLMDSYHRQNEHISDLIANNYDDVPTAEVFSESWVKNTRKSVKNRLDELDDQIDGIVDDDIALNAMKVADDFKTSDAGLHSSKLLDRWADKFTNLADSGKHIDGKQYEAMREQLRKTSKRYRNNIAGGKPIADAMDEYGKLLEKAVDNGLDSGNDLFRQTRRDYALINAIDDVRLKDRAIRGISEAGHIDARDLQKKFGSSDLIKGFADLQGLRMRQRKSSLSTSALLGRALGGATTGSPNDALGSLMLIGSRAPGGDVGMVNDALAKLYMSGVPANTGIAPIFGRKFTEPAFQRGVPRGLMAINNGSEADNEERAK